MKILVDTNVFLDIFLERDSSDPELFLKNCVIRNNQIYVTSQTLRDIEYSAHKFFHEKKKAKEIQSAVYNICSKVIGISADAAIESLYSDVDDYEDSLQVEAAKEAMLDCIVTSNKKDYQKSYFPVFTPKEINDIWANQKTSQ